MKKWYRVYYHGKAPVLRLIRPELVEKMRWYAMKKHHDVVFEEM